jgi:hypothetical protein
MIDNLSAGGEGKFSSYSASYFNTLQNEYELFLKNYIKENGLENTESAYKSIEKELNNIYKKSKVKMSSVSDLFYGLSEERIKDEWFHGYGYYTGDDRIQKLRTESFALFGESLIFKQNYDTIKKYFPKTLEAFEYMIGVL